MTGAPIKRLRQAFALTRAEFARHLGVYAVAVAKCETDARPLRGRTARLIAYLGDRVKEYLFAP